MKAIVAEIKNGPTQFLAYEGEEIYKHFRKLCHNSNMFYLETEEDFDEHKDAYVPLESYKTFQGAGVYDYDGNKHPVLKDEGGTVYYITEHTETTRNVKLVSNVKVLVNLVLILS